MAQSPELTKLKNALANDPVARHKFIASAIKFYEENGVKVTPDILKNFDHNAIEGVVTKGNVASTNIIAIF